MSKIRDGITCFTLLWIFLVGCFTLVAAAEEEVSGHGASMEKQYAVFPDKAGLKKNKKIVLVSGDEEYRSEEELTQLAKILSIRHGFDTVVLYAVDPETGFVAPPLHHNIPGLEQLRDADLMVLAIKVKALPDHQMKEILDYLRSGRPVFALRTATHAFRFPENSPYAYLSFRYQGERKDWEGGFGRRVLGETWVAHHGHHGVEGTRAIPAPGRDDHPILRGYADIVVPTDVYAVRLPMPEGTQVICLGAVLDGLKPENKPVQNKKNDPMMPVVWSKPYSIDGGKEGMALTTTMGSGVDLLDEGFRRLLVNGCYWLLGLADEIPQRSDVELVGEYDPLPYAFGKYRTGKRPGDF